MFLSPPIVISSPLESMKSTFLVYSTSVNSKNELWIFNLIYGLTFNYCRLSYKLFSTQVSAIKLYAIDYDEPFNGDYDENESDLDYYLWFYIIV